MGKRSIELIDAPELLSGASLDAIGRDRSDRSDRSDGVFSETPVQQELQPKNGEKEVLQNIPTSLGIVKETLQNTPQPIVKPDKNQGAIGNERSVRSVPIDFDKLKEGDILFHKNGTACQLIRMTKGMWATQRKDLIISRNDVRTGVFHLATVEDIANLIKQAIRSKKFGQFTWLCETYGDSPESLMSEAILKYPELAEIYEIADEGEDNKLKLNLAISFDRLIARLRNKEQIT